MSEGTATFLQIDLQNIFISSNQRIDLEKIWDHINDRETEFLIGSVVYTIHSNDFDSTKFDAKLRSIGYDIRVKNLSRSIKRFKNNSMTANLDVLITMECLLKKDLFDKWILISNNGSYSELCKYLRDIGKQVEIWCFRDSYDPTLEIYADKLHFITEDYCLKKLGISVFGINWGIDKFDSTSAWNVA